jgi:hypothetical protein
MQGTAEGDSSPDYIVPVAPLLSLPSAAIIDLKEKCMPTIKSREGNTLFSLYAMMCSTNGQAQLSLKRLGKRVTRISPEELDPIDEGLNEEIGS